MAQPTSGITSLTTLLASMSPTPDPTNTTYVFTTTPTNPLPLLTTTTADLDVQLLFRESTSWTLILPASQAEALGLETAFPCKKMTLEVHSSLDAVGFLAAVTTRVATDVGCGINPVSGFWHDHLFVPEGREGEVLACLRGMAEEASAGEK